MTSTLSRTTSSVGQRGRRRSRRRVLALFLSVALALALAALALFTPVLGVRNVRVQGARAVPEEQVLSAAHIAAGTPLLRLNTAAIAAKVATIPAVASVHVSRSLPSSVTITITERVPIGYRVERDYFRVLDSAGVGFRVQPMRPKTVPLIDAAAGSAQARAELAIAQSLPALLLSKVVTISAPTLQTLTLTLADSRVVLWGASDRNQDKARLLQALLTQPGGYFDLSDPDFVVSRPTP